MASLCWVTVIVTVFLSPANGLDQNYQNRLPTLVNGVLNHYRPPPGNPSGMFSVAVKVPGNLNQQVFNNDPDDTVRNTINNNGVYTGSRVVAAKAVRGMGHAESRVLDNLNGLFSGRAQTDWLLFYVYASPCDEICLGTGGTNILNRINHITQWGNNKYAFVFSKLFKPSNSQTTTDDRRLGAIQRLGNAIGLNNIFRCDGPRGRVQCNSCDNNGQVATNCYSG